MMSGNTIWHCSCAKRASKFVISNWSRSASVSTVIYFWSLHINLVPVYFSVYFQKSGPQPDQQSLLKRNSPAGQQEAPVTPADDLHWSKTLAKLQSQNQALSTELNKVKNENDELQSKLRQAERDTRDRREQSTNTPSNIHDRCVCVYIPYINFISKKSKLFIWRKERNSPLFLSAVLHWIDYALSVGTSCLSSLPSCPIWICRESAMTPET